MLRNCKNCDTGLESSDAGQTIRFVYLCHRCTSDGFRLMLYTNEPFGKRKWSVGVEHGGHWVRKGCQATC